MSASLWKPQKQTNLQIILRSVIFFVTNHTNKWRSMLGKVYFYLICFITLKLFWILIKDLDLGSISSTCLHAAFMCPNALFHQQYYTQLYQYTQLEVTPNFYTVHSMPCTSKIIVNLLVQKLIVQHWWYWPLGQFHQHFTGSFCPNILSSIEYKAKL